MPKAPSVPQTKNSRVIAACIVIAVLATAVVIAIVMLAGRTQAPASTIQTTLTGEFVCLPHKNTDGPQTMECAYGLQTEDNRYYALQFGDTFPTDIEMNKRVEVTGTLTTGTDSIYNITGTVKVESYHY